MVSRPWLVPRDDQTDAAFPPQIQMKDPRVAEIVQKTLHGYILNGRALVCQAVPEEHVHDNMFATSITAADAKRGRHTLKPRIITTRETEVARHNAPSNPQRDKRRVARLAKADKERRDRLKRKGIDYEYEGYRDTSAPAPTPAPTAAPKAEPEKPAAKKAKAEPNKPTRTSARLKA